MAESVVVLRVETSRATRALQGVQTRANKLQGAFNGLKASIAGIGVGLLAKQAVQTASNFEKLNVRLGLLTKANGTFARSQEIAANAQKAFGLSATEALEGITDITARLAPLGVGVEDIKSTFFGFNTAAKLAGASTIEASNAFRQLAQALGSGRLAGDEFRSISEQIPTLLQPIAKELDVPIGKLKELAADGELTSDVVLRALRKIETEGAASLKELVANDPTQVFKDFSNASEDLSRAFGELLLPALVPTVKGLTDLTKAAVDFVNSPIGQASLIIGGIALAAKGLPVLLAAVSVGLQKVAFAGGLAAVALNAIPFVAIATGATLLTAKLIETNRAKKEFNKLMMEGSEKQVQDAIDAQKESIKQLNIELGNSKGRDKKIIENKIKEANHTKKMLEDKMRSIESDKLIVESANKIVQIKKEELKTTRLANKEKEKNKKIAQDEADKIKKEEERKKEAFEKFIKRQTQSGELLQAAIDGNMEEVQLRHDINNAVAIHGEHNKQQIIDILTANSKLREQKDAIDENAQSAESLKEKFKSIGESVRSDIVDGLKDAINGSKSFGEAMSGVLSKLKDKLMDIALNSAIDGLFGGIGGIFSGGKGFQGGFLSGLFGKRANGGPVSAGGAFLVGEKGPEILQMGSRGGNITPNNKLGGGVTNINVSVDANSSNVTDNSDQAEQLGNRISEAIQAELIAQKRAGGLLYN